MINRSYKLSEMIRWGALVASIAFSTGVTKAKLTEFYTTFKRLESAEGENKRLLRKYAARQNERDNNQDEKIKVLQAVEG